MESMLQHLYEDLRCTVTVERLKEISADIIDHYRKQHSDILQWYGSIQDIPPETGTTRLFATLMQTYHPDKHSRIIRDIGTLFHQQDTAGLQRLLDIYCFTSHPAVPQRSRHIDVEEYYRYGADDFGYDEEAAFDSLDDYEEFQEETDEYVYDEDFGFIEALNLALFGNLNFVLETEDMKHLQGEIDLSDNDIEELQGIEHCVNIISFNLSANRISKIDRLGGLSRLESLFLSENSCDSIIGLVDLVNLRELDLSYNNIEDLSALLQLPALEYVNVVGNPIKDISVIEQLIQNGVIVVY